MCEGTFQIDYKWNMQIGSFEMQNSVPFYVPFSFILNFMCRHAVPSLRRGENFASNYLSGRNITCVHKFQTLPYVMAIWHILRTVVPIVHVVE